MVGRGTPRFSNRPAWLAFRKTAAVLRLQDLVRDSENLKDRGLLGTDHWQGTWKTRVRETYSDFFPFQETPHDLRKANELEIEEEEN